MWDFLPLYRSQWINEYNLWNIVLFYLCCINFTYEVVVLYSQQLLQQQNERNKNKTLQRKIHWTIFQTKRWDILFFYIFILWIQIKTENKNCPPLKRSVRTYELPFLEKLPVGEYRVFSFVFLVCKQRWKSKSQSTHQL